MHKFDADLENETKQNKTKQNTVLFSFENKT